MKKTCPHCNIEFEYEKYQQFGAHITNCKSNPKRDEIHKKISKKRVERFSYKFNCLFCGKEYELNLSESEYKSSRYKKCCCILCSSKYSQSFVPHNEIKKLKCVGCGEITDVKYIVSDKRCYCDKCGNYKNKENIKYIKAKKGLIKTKIVIDGRIICKICGQEKCADFKICKSWILGRSKIFVKFGFDISKLESLDFYDEYDRIVELLKYEYENNSLTEIGEKYNVNYQTIHMIFKNLGIKSRNLRDSVCLAFKKGRYDLSNINIYPYKSGYHTSWENKTFWLRSSYELNFCKILDENKVRYDVEKIRIQYFDTTSNCERTSIPDFYLPDTNELVEIKSSWTYDYQNMKDKVKSYRDNGYNFKLILDGEELVYEN